MGYHVESYSLNELHRIAIPGKVVPSLFWVLPVGNWQSRELDELWGLFTDGNSECNNLGLLLVKDNGRREDGKTNVDLASVGAKLSDLMPAGTERFVRSSAYRGEKPRVLVLSGGYPQPGWGVLVEWRRRDIHHFEELIRGATTQLREKEPTSELNVFKEAAQCFQNWKTLGDAPPEKPNMYTLEGEISAAEKIASSIRDARNALHTGAHRLVKEKIIGVKEGLLQAAWLGISNSMVQALLDTENNLLAAASIIAVSREDLESTIEPLLESSLRDPIQKGNAFKSLSCDEEKNALKACLDLRGKGIVGKLDSFHEWAERSQTHELPKLEADLARLSEEIEIKLAGHLGKKEQLKREYEFTLEQWRPKSTAARELFHSTVGKSVEAQWKLGPQFLVAFEHVCQQEELWVRSIPWDPARMVGWKIMVSQVKIDPHDLRIAAKELAPASALTFPTMQVAPSVADGSYFTDYVHYIAISKPGFSPHSVTLDLLAHLIRPGEMIALIQTHGGVPSAEADRPQLAGELLYAFGWRQSDEVREKPLAGCIQQGPDGSPILQIGISANDLRIVLESFCKDILDVVVSQLGYSVNELWDVIHERIPGYNPRSTRMDWGEEVGGLMLGGAVLLLGALGPLAFPGRVKEITEFVTELQKLKKILNPPSHHQEDGAVSLTALDDSPALIRKLLGAAEVILGELPWHLDVSFVYGDQPKVLSGEAWSHGSDTPRLLRVIVSTGTVPSGRIKFWNPSRKNPIVPDPVFIVRPR